jgi:spore germination protein
MLNSWLKYMRDSKQKQSQEQNKHEKNNQDKNIQEKESNVPSEEENFSINLFTSVEQNIENFKKMYGNSTDLATRDFLIGKNNHKGALLFIDGLIDKNLVYNLVLKNLQLEAGKAENSLPKPPEELLKALYKEVISISEGEIFDTMDDVSLAILSGDTAIFFEGTAKVLVINSKGWPTRSLEEPVTEALIRGPRDGFIENLRTNTVLIRRYVRDPNLRFDAYKVGRRSKKDLVVSYIEGITHPDLVKEVERRIKSIDMDSVPESGYIEQWIEDSFLSPFPQIMHTERPDKVSTALMQGKVAILLDGHD